MLVIFDVCDTLYAANTTFGFLRHYQQTSGHRALAGALRRWGSKASPAFYFGAAVQRLAHRDLARERAIAALAGESRADLAAAAAEYAADRLESAANVVLHDRLRGHLAAGDRVVLVSSSLDIVIEPVARRLGVEWRASELEFHDGLCTGRLASDLTARKSHVVRQLAGSERIKVYTDNRSDRDLIELADEAVIVVPAGRPTPRWGTPDCDYVRL